MIEEKIARAKKLIAQREAIDAELAALFNVSKRGRPSRKEMGNEGESWSHSVGMSITHGESLEQPNGKSRSDPDQSAGK